MLSPYPGLFLSDYYAAWALGLKIDIFRQLASTEPNTSWLQELRGAEYDGPLSDFLGRRWWRPGIDQLVWSLDEKTSEVGTRREAFAIMAPTVQVGELHPPSSYVVICNEDLQEVDIAPIAEAIQVHPPGWPAEALEPWMLRAEVERDPVLKAMADPTDLA